MAGRVFTIDSSIRNLAYSAFADLIEQLGKPCAIVYPPKMEMCVNCWTAGTMISTPDGPKRIENILAGDFVFNQYSQPRRVVRTYAELYNGLLFNIKSYGISLPQFITAEHKIPVVRNLRELYTQKQWYNSDYVLEDPPVVEIPAKSIRVGDAVIIPYINFSSADLDHIEYEGEKLVFDDDLCYFIGWWLAEGCIAKDRYPRTSSFCLCSTDEEHIADKLIKIAQEKFGIMGKKEFRSNAANLLVHFYSAKLARFLFQFGNGAANKFIPSHIYNSASISQLYKIVDAYRQGDGNVFSDESQSIKDRYSVTTISEKLAFQVFEILNSSGYIPSINFRDGYIDKNAVNHCDRWTIIWQNARIQQKSGVRRSNIGILSTVRKIESVNKTISVYNLEVEIEHKYIANNIISNNCHYDPIGKKSSNRYLHGGPISFPMGSICPLCGGVGYKAIEVEETVTLLINEDPKTFQIFGSTAIHDGTIQTKGFIVDLPKIMKCSYMIKDLNIRPYIEYRYKLASEPLVPANIAPGKIFVANWTRI